MSGRPAAQRQEHGGCLAGLVLLAGALVLRQELSPDRQRSGAAWAAQPASGPFSPVKEAPAEVWRHA